MREKGLPTELQVSFGFGIETNQRQAMWSLAKTTPKNINSLKILNCSNLTRFSSLEANLVSGHVIFLITQSFPFFPFFEKKSMYFLR